MTTPAAIPSSPLPELLAQAAWAQRLAHSLVRDPDDAGDLVQETWMAALHRPPEARTGLRPWFATVLRRQRARQLVSSRRRAEREHAVASLLPDVPSPEQLLQRMEAQRALAALVTSLAEPYRQTVLLRYFEGLSAAEIARRLQIPAATVRGRLKTGLDRLRTGLDADNHGDRRVWQRMLTPLLPAGALTAPQGWPARPPVHPAAKVIGLSLATAALLGLALWVSRGPRTSRDLGGVGVAASSTGGRPRGPDRGPLPPSGRSGGGDPTAVRAVAAFDAAACDADVTRLRQTVAQLETVAMKKLAGKVLFARDPAANPTAERELAPILARIMKADQASAPAYTVECHTWVCQMNVAKTPEEATPERTNKWMLPLQRDPEMQARTTMRGFDGDPAVRDPISGMMMAHEKVFLTLKDPSAKAVPDATAGPRPDLRFGPLPTDPVACREESAALRARQTIAETDVVTTRRADERFLDGALNPGLTAEMRAEVKRTFGADADTIAVECHELICRFRGPEPVDSWRRRLEAARDFRIRFAGALIGHETYYTMKPPAQVTAALWLRNLADTFAAGPGPLMCADQSPDAQGKLYVVLSIPTSGEPNPDGVVDRLSARYEGALADTALGACIAGEVARTVLATLPPPAIAADKFSVRLQFPLLSSTVPR
jgi:RNA polymerase sigma-70 factor (ECF subfamily)